MAALPFVFDSLSSGMYAISLHGSNNEYFELLLKIFCAAPTTTANISGVVPKAAETGAKKSEKKFNAKKDSPVTPIIYKHASDEGGLSPQTNTVLIQ